MTGTTIGARTRRRAGALAGGLVAALALAACGTQVAGSGGAPPPLRIGSPAAVGAVDSAVRGRAGGAISLDGTLPDGPATGTVQRFGTGRVAEDRVRALAASLGMSAAPVRGAHGWKVDDGPAALRVRDGDGEWSYARSVAPCPAYVVDVDAPSGSGSSVCAEAVDPSAAARPSARPDADAALSAARPVLAAAGVDGDPRALGTPRGQLRTVVVDPVVAGLPTAGLRTLVDVDATGVASAYGRLGTTTPGATYPLVGARSAYDALAARPRVVPELACVEARDTATVCPEPTPQVVTGATLGLTLAQDGDEPVLVPAWLFDVRGSDEPLVAIAVQPQFLADPDPAGPPASTPGTEPGSGEPDSGSQPGSPGASSEPGPGSGDTAAAITGTRLSDDGRTLTLVGYGGTCATYLGLADESGAGVTAQIVGTSTIGPDQACNAMAVEVEVKLLLDEPLGRRTVTDATTGERVAVSTR